MKKKRSGLWLALAFTFSVATAILLMVPSAASAKAAPGKAPAAATASPPKPKVVPVGGSATASAAKSAQPAVAGSKVSWRKSIGHVKAPGSGCYHAVYPALTWTATKCATGVRMPFMAPQRASAPGPAGARASRGAVPEDVGKGDDDSVEVAGGKISAVNGWFSNVSPKISETGIDFITQQKTPNAFSLQLNSQQWANSPFCAHGGSSCRAWEQFVYDYTNGNGYVFIQNWLINYVGTCPSGWSSFAGTSDEAPGCVENSSISELPAPLSAADLANVGYVTSAAAGGEDQLGLSTSSSDEATLASESDSTLALAANWTEAEWNVVGDGNGTEATFGAGSSLQPEMSLTSTTGTDSAPSCHPEGWTAEYNNLTLTEPTGFTAGVAPQMAFAESDTGGDDNGCADAEELPGLARTVMAVGDSISEGFEGDVTWRYDLASTEANSLDNLAGFQMVGPWTGTDTLPASLPAGWPTNPSTPSHAGAYAPGEEFPGTDGNDDQNYAQWGWQMTQAEPDIENEVATYKPNYLLVELGFNDLAWGIQSPNGLLDEVKDFVAAARAANPSIQILFANVVQRAPLPIAPNLEATITSYDKGLPDTLAALSTTQSPVDLVDLESKYSYSTDTYDGLHPNNVGEWVIADAFANALASDFGIGPGSTYLPGSATEVSIDAPTTAPTLTPNAGGINISWPHEFGVEGYMLEVANTTWGQTLGGSTELPLPVPADSWELEELVPGDSYQVAIAAARGYDVTSFSPPSNVVVAEPTTPAPPTNISVTSVSGGIDLSWTTPTGQNDSNITGYDIAWEDNTADTGALYTTQVTGNSYEITDGDGIAAGDLIGVALSAVNPSGEGYPTGSSVIPDTGAPVAPTINSDVEEDPNDDYLSWTPGGNGLSTAGYWIDIYGYPASGDETTLQYELPPSTTAFTAGYLDGLAGSVTICIQAANGTQLSTIAPLGSDCAAASGGGGADPGIASMQHLSASTASSVSVPQASPGEPANTGIPYQYFSNSFRLALEGVGPLSATAIAHAGAVNETTGKLVPTMAPDSIQALLGKPHDFVVVVPPHKYK